MKSTVGTKLANLKELKKKKKKLATSIIYKALNFIEKQIIYNIINRV